MGGTSTLVEFILTLYDVPMLVRQIVEDGLPRDNKNEWAPDSTKFPQTNWPLLQIFRLSNLCVSKIRVDVY